ARALYSDADIYLFDDTLSAVDGTVANNIIKKKVSKYQKCINDYLKEKTRILISHQGKIEAEGTYNQLLDSHLKELSCTDKTISSGEFDSSVEDTVDEVEFENKKKLSEDLKLKQELIKKEREEVQQKGAVGWNSYASYFTAGTGYFGLIGVIFLFLTAQAMTISADYWLSIWSNLEEEFEYKQKLIKSCLQNLETQNVNCTQILFDIDSNTDPSSINLIYDDRERSYKIYLTLVCTAFIVVAVRSVAFFIVRDTSIRFYDLNPIGRILNRFSKDTNNMDEMLTLYLYDFCQVAMVILGGLVVPISVNPWLILPLVPLGFVFFLIKNYFISTARELKRLDNIGRSPLFVYANTTIEGISTIRVANKEKILAQEFNVLTDYHTRACFAFFVVNRWFGLRLDFLCSLYTIITLFGSLLLKDYLGLKPGQVGLLMVYLFQLFHLFQWSIALWTNVENLMTSIERIV
ncbi:multidrug resistance-associated 4-like, partial [Brachionus plicatilis]